MNTLESIAITGPAARAFQRTVEFEPGASKDTDLGRSRSVMMRVEGWGRPVAFVRAGRRWPTGSRR